VAVTAAAADDADAENTGVEDESCNFHRVSYGVSVIMAAQ